MFFATFHGYTRLLLDPVNDKTSVYFCKESVELVTILFQDVVSASAPLSLDSAEELANVLAERGSKEAVIRQGWGMTELSAPASFGSLLETDKAKLYGHLGDPLAMTEVSSILVSTPGGGGGGRLRAAFSPFSTFFC